MAELRAAAADNNVLRALVAQAAEAMDSFSDGPCLDGCEHDDCEAYMQVLYKLQDQLGIKRSDWRDRPTTAAAT